MERLSQPHLLSGTISLIAKRPKEERKNYSEAHTEKSCEHNERDGEKRADDHKTEIRNRPTQKRESQTEENYKKQY